MSSFQTFKNEWVLERPKILIYLVELGGSMYQKPWIHLKILTAAADLYQDAEKLCQLILKTQTLWNINS